MQWSTWQQFVPLALIDNQTCYHSIATPTPSLLYLALLSFISQLEPCSPSDHQLWSAQPSTCQLQLELELVSHMYMSKVWCGELEQHKWHAGMQATMWASSTTTNISVRVPATA